MLSCQVLGHRPRFRTEGPVLLWECERGCGESGSKTYGTAADAARYAKAFDRQDRSDLGRRAPLLGLLPLRLMRLLRRPRGD
ncbi:MAG TPA: hypothetical protein VFJ14_10730 [Nocardioidaceae bacterium]|nr:hypothetical protein [Nocardioidaceae bacterium]